MTPWLALHPRAPDFLGLIPEMVSADDPRSAREQLDENYAHGGGWHPMPAGKWAFDEKTSEITHPGDEPLQMVACCEIHGDIVAVYPHAFVAIIKPDKSFEVARMD